MNVILEFCELGKSIVGKCWYHKGEAEYEDEGDNNKGQVGNDAVNSCQVNVASLFLLNWNSNDSFKELGYDLIRLSLVEFHSN